MHVLLSLAFPALIMSGSAILAIRADHLQQKNAYFLFKPLTTLLIFAYACLALESLQDRRGLLVLSGLFASLLGDVFLLFPKRFLLGLASFFVAHLFYLAAFYTGSSAFGMTFIAIPLLVCSSIILFFLWKGLGRLKFAVVPYILLITAMLYQAGERYLVFADLASLVALCGAVLFMLSDTFLAFNRFRRPFAYAGFWVLSSYYVAQWLIALSLYLRFR